MKPIYMRQDDARRAELCPICEQQLSEVRVTKAGVCPMHGIRSWDSSEELVELQARAALAPPEKPEEGE